MMSEADDSRWYGNDYVVAGRMVRELTALRIVAIDRDDWPLAMTLWAAREHIVNEYRRVRVTAGTLRIPHNSGGTTGCSAAPGLAAMPGARRRIKGER
jgi:hypothetical protein